MFTERKIMTDTLSIQRRAIQYWFNDGIIEIAFGGILFVLGIFFFVTNLLPEHSTIRIVLESSFALIFLGAAYGVNRLAAFAKERITYPRSGYVRIKQRRSSPRWLIILTSSIIAGTLAGLVQVFQELQRWLPAMLGLLIAVVIFVMAIRSKLSRLFGEALLSIAIGVAIAVWNIPEPFATPFLYTSIGICIGLVGLCVMVQFISNSSVPQENDNE
jgi:putative exporter of polyketide antibiotics